MLAASLLALVTGVWLLASVGITTSTFEDSMQGDTRRAVELLESDFGEAPTELIILTPAQGEFSPQAVESLGAELGDTYAGLEGVDTVGTPFPGADGSLVLPVELIPDAEGEARDVSAVSAATERLSAAHPELVVGQFGDASLSEQVNDRLGDDFQRAELYSIPLTLAVLLVAFGAVLAAGIPLVLGLGSVGVALGLTALVSTGITPVDPNAQSLVLLIGLAVGVDYALFVLRRAREERAAGASVRDSIGIAGATAGRAVAVSGLTVVVSMSGMLVAGGMFASMGIGAMLVVGVAVVAVTTTLPALLSVLGDKVEWLRLPFVRRRRGQHADAVTRGSAWGRLAGAVTRRPATWAVVSTGCLLALAAPALSLKTSLGGLEALPQDIPGVAAYHQLEQAVPSDGESLTLVATAPAASSDEVQSALLARTDQLLGMEHVTGVAPQVRTSTDGTVATWDVGIDLTSSDEALPAVVDEVRAQVLPLVRAEAPGAEVYLAGSALNVDMTDWMDSRLPWVLGFVLVLTLVVMAVSFGSLSLAAATVALNLLSAGAAYGVLELVFGGSTWAQDLLGFTTTGTVAAWLPLMLFVVLFGLSMDYHVFVVSRVREARDHGASATEAIRYGVARSAGVVTAAAVVMVGVFSVFGTLSMLEMKQMGVGLAAAILLDATVVRGVLLPATLALLGERAHTGPRWLPHLAH